MSQLVKSSIILTFFTVCGVALTFVSYSLIAAKFGSGQEMDVYFTASVIPLFFIGILSSALNFVLIPIFAEFTYQKENEITIILNSLLNIGLLVAVFITIMGILNAPILIRLIAGSFSEEKVCQSVYILRILFPMVVFTVINEILNSFYYAHKNFFLPAFNKIITPTITIFCILIFQASMGVSALAFAMLVASVIQMILLWLGFSKNPSFHYNFSISFHNPILSKVCHISTPLILGMIIYRLTPVFDRFFLSQLPEGSVAHIGYATQLLNFIQLLMTTAVVIPLFPLMSQYAAGEKWHDLCGVFSKGLKILLFISLPCTFLFGLHSEPFIQLLWERHHFLPGDTKAVYEAFMIYSLALPVMAMAALVVQGFYVLQDTMTLMFIGIAETVLYFVLCNYFVPKYQYLGVPIAFFLYFSFSFIVLTFILHYKLKNWGGIHSFLKDASKYVLSLVISWSVLSFLLPMYSNPVSEIILIVLSFILYVSINRFIFKTNEVVYFYNLIARGINFYAFAKWSRRGSSSE